MNNKTKNKIIAILTALVIVFSLFSCNASNKSGEESNKKELIIDTDVGSDCDDMLALAYAIYAEENLNMEIKAITYSSSAEYGISAIRAFYSNLGKTPPPIGKSAKELVKYDNYCKQIVENFDPEQKPQQEKDAVSVLRKALVDSKKATICAIGPMTNISMLLDSKGDEISPLTGKELVEQKCEKLVLMAGKFENQEITTPEWNISLDIESAQNIINEFPAPIYFISYELGKDLITGKSLVEKGEYENPLSMSYILFPGVKEAGGRSSWDPLAMYFAVEGVTEYLTISENITVSIEDDGRSYVKFKKNNHYILYFKQYDGSNEYSMDKISKYLDECAISIYDR